jgi:glycosyltransferase involved in cell wall biosynthesis
VKGKENRSRLLFLTTDLPFPPDSGGKIKTFRLIEFLAKSFDVHVLCAYGGMRTDDVKAYRAISSAASIQAFQNHLPRTPWHFFRGLMTAPSFNAYRIRSEELATMVKWVAQASDAVVIDHLEVVDLIPEKLSCPVLYHSHNAEHVLWREYARFKGSAWTRWIYEWEASRVQALERYAIRKSAITFAAPNDQNALKKLNGIDPERFRRTYHLGHDLWLELPAANLDQNQPKVFYAGTLSWEPNRDGLAWFLTHVWPLVHAAAPSAIFQICGRGADKPLLDLMQRSAGVEHLGFVEDLEPIMTAARVAVIPLRFGSGMKIKTFDALYRGIPVVSTTIGMEGIDAVNNVHAWIVDDVRDFAAAVISALHDTRHSTTIRDSARELCRERYRYDALLSEMAMEIRDLLKD